MNRYTRSPFLDTGYLKMALRVQNVSGAFEKLAPGLDVRV